MTSDRTIVLQATPGYGSLLIVAQVSGTPEHYR
jgi:hypothetical protein